MFLLFIISLKINEVSFLSFNNKTSALQSFNDFLHNASQDKKIKWIFMYDSETSISKNYIIEILSNIKNKNTIVGRIGCLPTDYINYFNDFEICHKYPLIEAGFAFSSDLIPFYKTYSPKLDYSIGISFKNANFIDDFNFSFLSPYKKREQAFLATFSPYYVSDLPDSFIHATGIKISLKLSPFFKTKVKLGTNIMAFGKNTSVSSILNFHCLSSSSKHNIINPPSVASESYNIYIKCFDHQ